jgi:alpha-N-arabinofuranosidase
VVAEVDPRLCGSFVEHLGRVVYGGIYEPAHPSADASGYRTDVRDLVKELGVTTVRYPGGNFVSAYDWKDGIGPRQARPRRADPAWRSLETNEFGLNEFMGWCETVDVEPFLVFNLGTLGVESACQMVEYCNGTAGSSMADLRRAHGREAPYGVRLWGLGNEMDGDWQVGARSAAEYGSLASQVARAVKRMDDSIEVVAAGSSHRAMKTFPEWDRVVLEQSYEYVDYLALHEYFPANVLDLQSFAASGADFERYMAAGIATCDYVRELKRSKRRVNLAMDEWNVNYREGRDDWEPWQVAPHIAEFEYHCRDAVVTGGLLISLLRHADRVKVACQSLLVNVGGPIRAEAQGQAVKQAIFTPIAEVFNTVRERSVLAARTDSPEVATSAYGDVPALDATAVVDGDNAKLTLFAVNRSTTRGLDVEVALHGFGAIGTGHGRVLSGSSGSPGPGAAGLAPVDVHLVSDNVASVRMEPFSWAAIDFALK